MSPRSPQQYEDIRESKKKLILDTALGLFAAQGFHNTSISQIARKAEISKGLLYNYFDSKDDLLMEILDAGVNEVLDVFDPNHDGSLSDQEFKFFIDMIFKSLREKRDYWHLYFSLALQPTVFELIQQKYTKLAEASLAVMENFYKRKQHPEPKMQALMFSAFMDGISLNYIMNPEQFPLEEVKNYIFKNYLKPNENGTN